MSDGYKYSRMKNHSPQTDATSSYIIDGPNHRSYLMHAAVSGAVLAKNHDLAEFYLKDFVSYKEKISAESFEAWTLSCNDACKVVISKYAHLVAGRVS